MEIHLFLALFAFGVLLFYLSTRISDFDLSNVYQTELTFMSMIVWVALAYSSFNIEILYTDGTNLFTSTRVDNAYIGLSWAFLILSLLNIIILSVYGSWNMLFKMTPKQEFPKVK